MLHLTKLQFYFLFSLLLLLLNFHETWSKPYRIKTTKTATCNNCHPTSDEKINIHLIPHSHDDVGWLKTVDQYYYGGRSFRNIEDAGVQYIIGSSIQALNGHPNRRYIQVESAFFWKWWQAQAVEMQQNVIELVNNGQLEIINGAWSMNDEAATNYQSIIDQFTWGFRFLNDSLGECARPKVGWQIDPFGHSREHASLLTQFGFEGLVIGRIDYRDKHTRIEQKNLDFMWTASANLNNSHLFTTMFPDFYVSVSGFCFDIVCYRYDYINPNKNSPDYNLESKVKEFASVMDKYSKYYKTSNILIPMGGDFTFQAAEMHFTSIDYLIQGFQNHEKYNVFYSTPSCYIEAVNAEINKHGIQLKEKTDDFFPYGSDDNAIWTGYFTSRPTTKRFERIGNNILQSVKQLNSFEKVKNGGDDVNGNKNIELSLQMLREVMGVMQHHDAITGTEKQKVAYDYVRLLTAAIKKAEDPIGGVIGNLLKIENQQSSETNQNLILSTCLLSNISICEQTTPQKFIVTVYNPLSRPVNHYVRLPIEKDQKIKITGPDGDEIYDIFDPISNFDYVKEKNLKPKPKELIFKAGNIPPLGVKLYYIQKGVESDAEADFDEKNQNGNAFDIDKNGKLSSVTLNGKKLEISQEFAYYTGKSNGGRSSGAYIFRPIENSAVVLNPKQVETQVQDGKLVKEIKQVFNKEASQILRMYKHSEEDFLELDWLVGDLQKINGNGREIVTKFQIKNFNNNAIFYTDSNGREQIRRKLNYRPDFELYPKNEPVSNNYFPITSKITLKDEKEKIEVTVLNDRAQGGTSLTEGSIELMVHRRLSHDDGFGVSEALNEQEYNVGMYVRGQHYLTFGDVGKNAGKVRDLAQKKLLAPWVLVGEAKGVDSLEMMQELYRFEFSGLTRSLPPNVQILTLEPWREDTILLRLEHTLEKNEDSELSKPVIIDLKELFTLFDIVEIGETTLGANQWLDDYDIEEKLTWYGYDNGKPLKYLDVNDPLKVSLEPMQIRTFIIRVVPVQFKE